jgi:hypothetical protein
MASLVRGAASLTRITASSSKSPIQFIHRRGLAGAAGYFPFLYFSDPIFHSIKISEIKLNVQLNSNLCIRIIEIENAENFISPSIVWSVIFAENLVIAVWIACCKALIVISVILKLQFYFCLKYSVIGISEIFKTSIYFALKY